jgi:hypothetical protein
MNEFFQRLKQLKLVQWAVGYVAAAFALLQGIDVIAQQFGWPDGVPRGITLAMVVGFFVTLVLAWYHRERGTQTVSGIELLIVALLLSLGGAFLWRVVAMTTPPLKLGVTSAVPAGPRTPIPEKSIAVLPFENLSDDKSANFSAHSSCSRTTSRLWAASFVVAMATLVKTRLIRNRSADALTNRVWDPIRNDPGFRQLLTGRNSSAHHDSYR